MWSIALKQLWKNRKSNLWISLEIMVVSVLMWYCVDFLYVVVKKTTEPMGVNTEHVYRLSLGMYQTHKINAENSDSVQAYLLNPLEQVLSVTKAYPGVEAVAMYVGTEHFTEGNMFQGYTVNGKDGIGSSIRYVSKDYGRVFKVAMQSGGMRDWSRNATPLEAIISPEFADTLFHAHDVVGKSFFDIYQPELKYTVAGVSKPMKFDRYSRYEPFILTPMNNLLMLLGYGSTPSIAVRVGDDADYRGYADEFMESMRTKLNIGPYYLFNFYSFDQRAEIIDTASGVNSYTHVIIGLVLFFLFIVFVGLLGTFWFQMESRRNEIGLRVAIGSSRLGVLSTIVRESLVLFWTAYIPAFVVCFVLAYLDVTYTFKECMDYTWGRFAITQVITALVMMLIVMAGSLFPAWRSSRLHPVEALRTE